MEPTTTALALVRRRDTHEGKTVVAPAAAAGIKLFGQTITTLLPQPSTFKKEPENNDDADLSTFNRRTTADRSTSNDTTTTTEEHKRPDKIIPCPRCSSMDTKFCYFNNYNVNQPRHFCKGCQRYWTAGGALRNVPIGAGRRKLKPVGGSGSGSEGGGQLFVGGFVAERSGEFDKTVVEEYYWANHQRRIMVAGARSIGYCEDYQDDKRRKIESSTT